MRGFILIAGFVLTIQCGYTQETVLRINTIDSIEIEGNLIHAGYSKLVLFIAGSGPTDRNCNNSMGLQTDAFKLLADTLSSNGISSFRYDKRGIGLSTPVSEANLTIQDYIFDASFLVDHFSNEYDEVYLFGHSEGALIGKVVTQENRNVDGFLSVCGTSVPLDDIIREQLAKFPKLLDLAEVHLQEIENDEPLSEVNPMLMSLFRESVVPYLKSVFALDPIEEIKKINTKTLIVGGSCDRQVSTEHSNALHEANPSTSLLNIESMGHVLKSLESDCSNDLNSYSDPTMSLHPELVHALFNFIGDQD